MDISLSLSKEVVDEIDLERNFTIQSFNPITSTAMERILSRSNESLSGEVLEVTSADNTSQGLHFYGWHEPGTIGFGISDSAESTHIVNCCFGVILIIIGLAGSSGNGLVLYVFTRYRRLRGGGGPLILSLASGDFVVSILHILPAFSSFNNKWAFGSVGCSLYAASVGLCGIASLLTLSAIAADRFSVIVGHPLVWLAGKKTCLAIWLVSTALTCPPFFGWSRYCLEGLGTSCSWDYSSRDLHNRLYYISLLSVGFMLPVTIIIVSYVGILYVVCKQETQLDVTSKVGGIISKKKPTKNDIKTAQVIFTIIICFLIAWTPYAIVSLIGQFGDESAPVSPMGTALPAIFAKSSVVFNPIVYGISHPHFRSAVRALHTRSIVRKPSRSHHHGNYKEQYLYNYCNVSKNGTRCAPAMKHMNINDGTCNGSGERMRRETRRQRETWKQQHSLSTRMMSDVTTTGQNNRPNMNMLLVVQQTSALQKHMLFFENNGQLKVEDIHSIYKYYTDMNTSDQHEGKGGKQESINTSEPNLSTRSKNGKGRVIFGENRRDEEAQAYYQGRKNQKMPLSRSESSLALVPTVERKLSSSISFTRNLSSGNSELSKTQGTTNNNIKSYKNRHGELWIRNDCNFASRETSLSTDDSLREACSNDIETFTPKYGKNSQNCIAPKRMAYKPKCQMGDIRSKGVPHKANCRTINYNARKVHFETKFSHDSEQLRRASTSLFEDRWKNDFGLLQSGENDRMNVTYLKNNTSNKKTWRWRQKFPVNISQTRKLFWGCDEEQTEFKSNASVRFDDNVDLIPDYCSSFI